MNDDRAGFIAGVMWLLTILASIGSGVLAWNWIEPDSFLGAIGFLIVWGILSKIAHFIAFGLIYAMFRD